MLRLFSRKKGNEEITKEIQGLLDDKSIEEKFALLTYIMSEVAKSDIESTNTKLYLDSSILEMLKRVYTPKGVLVHLSLITHNLVQQYPDLIPMLQTEPQNIDNGVV